MSLFEDIRNIKGEHINNIKIDYESWDFIIKGQINIPSGHKMTRREKTKGQKGSQRVTTARIKGEETLLPSILDLLFRFSVLSYEGYSGKLQLSASVRM